MAGYVKLFGSILDSTIWHESSDTRVVWITMLAMADRDGIVESSIPGLAKRAGVTREACEAALAVFERPDPDSRTPDHDGRRASPIAGGWRLLNYERYREKANVDEQRSKAAARQARWRERHKADGVTPDVTESNAPLRPVTASNDIQKQSQKQIQKQEEDLAADRAAAPGQSTLFGSDLDGAPPAAKQKATLYCTRDEALAAIAAESNGRFIASPPDKGGVFKLDKLRKRPDVIAVCNRVGRWIAANGEWKADRRPLDGRNIGPDLDAWVAQSEAWEKRGGGIVQRTQANGAARSRALGPVEPSVFDSSLPDGYDALQDYKG